MTIVKGIKTQRRLVFLDVFKGVAIGLVVFGHVDTANTHIGWYKTLVQFIYVFHMPMFMFASGYLYSTTGIPNTLTKYGQYLQKKVGRLVVPYFALAILVLCIKSAASQYVVLEYPVRSDFLYRIILNPAGGYATFLWFIYTLFIIFLIHPVISSICLSQFAVMVVVLCIQIISWPEIFCLRLAMHNLVFFQMGVLVMQGMHGTEPRGGSWILLAGGGGVWAGASLFQQNHFYLEDPSGLSIFIRIIAAGAAIMFFIEISRLMSGHTFISSSFQMLGALSAPIYLFHTLCMGPIKVVFHQFKIYDNHFLGYVILSTLVGLLGPFALYRYVFSRSRPISRILLGA